MDSSLKCANPPCDCRGRGSSRYCSAECEAAVEAESESSDCPCGHKACNAKQELDVAGPGRSSEAARDAGVDLPELAERARKLREKP